MISDGKYTLAGVGVGISFGILFWVLFDLGVALSAAMGGSLALLLGVTFGSRGGGEEDEGTATEEALAEADSGDVAKGNSETSADAQGGQ